MKRDPIARFSGLLAATALITSGAWTQSLIRKDLLKSTPAEIASPRRDIFSPRTGSTPLGISQPGEFPGGRVPEAGKSDKPPAMKTAGSSLDLSYIGYIQSGNKMIALIVLEGQAMAVTEGEEVLPGVKVGKVDLERIDVIGPNAKRSSFPLQGEQP